MYDWIYALWHIKGIQLPIYHTQLSHVQLCDMSESNPLVTPINNGTTCVNMIDSLQNRCMCVLNDILDVKQFLIKT